MGKITVEDCKVDGVVIEGLKVITPTVFGDERGYFVETYNENDMNQNIYNQNLNNGFGNMNYFNAFNNNI